MLANILISLHEAHTLPTGDVYINTTTYCATLRVLTSAIIHNGALIITAIYSSIAAQFELEESHTISLGQVSEGVHIASMVALLASPVSAWTVGSCTHVNGGNMAAALRSADRPLAEP